MRKTQLTITMPHQLCKRCNINICCVQTENVYGIDVLETFHFHTCRYPFFVDGMGPAWSTWYVCKEESNFSIGCSQPSFLPSIAISRIVVLSQQVDCTVIRFGREDLNSDNRLVLSGSRVYNFHLNYQHQLPKYRPLGLFFHERTYLLKHQNL